MFVIMKNKNTIKFEKYAGIVESTEFKSFDNLFKILPRGTLSKNSFNDEKSRLVFIDSWIVVDIFGLEKA